MNVTFSLFGYFFSLQIFRNLLLPIDRIDWQPNISPATLNGTSVDLECIDRELEEIPERAG